MKAPDTKQQDQCLSTISTMRSKKEASMKNKGKIDQHDFLVAWSIGMNDYEIAQKLGISLSTVKEVKSDLFNGKTD